MKTAVTIGLSMMFGMLAVTAAADTDKSKQSALTLRLEPQTTEKKETCSATHHVNVWLTKHKGRTFRVTKLPRCEHVEAVIAWEPSGETVQEAKNRLGGVAAVSGSYHHPKTHALADFMQRNGIVYSPATTGRPFLAMYQDGKVDVSRDYNSVKGQSGVDALALGQSLVPLRRDGFSVKFMNRVTDRMAVGVDSDYIYLIQGKSDIWRLADFLGNKLKVDRAVNCDGGHVVRGKAPVHIVFKWREEVPQTTFVAQKNSR